MERSEFFSKAFKLVVGKALEAATENRVVETLEGLAVKKERPPGALTDEQAFLATCTGCDQCMSACPHNVIMIEDMEPRDPVIYPEKDPCVHCPDTPCIAACPTGALLPEDE